MFVEDGSVERNALRQGDIIEGIPLPLLEHFEKLVVLGETQPGNPDLPNIALALLPHNKDPNWFTAHVRMRLCYCVMLSQCCELELRNGQMIPPAFTVARLIPVKKTIAEDPDKLGRLKANPNPEAGPSYYQYFYIGSYDRLGGNTEWMVDFSQITSFPKTEYNEFVKRKVLQMDDRSRVKFKLKAGWYLARITDEEDRDGLRNPWGEETIGQPDDATRDNTIER